MEKGAVVSYHDPLVPSLAHEGQDMQSVALDERILASTDVIVIVTDHSQVDWGLISRSGRPVLDTRDILKRERMKEAEPAVAGD